MNNLKNLSFTDLKIIANKNRVKILDMVYSAKSGHLGGALSAVDIITYVCEFIIDYKSSERDRFLLSKGHAVAALYAEFNNLGIIKDAELMQFRALNSRLQGHTSIRYIPEVDITTGLLGQGLSYGVGMAIAKKIKKNSNIVYVMTGDGELHEGQIWEAMMEASHYNLDNLVLIVDRNKLCSDKNVEKVINIEPLNKRISSFGWDVMSIDDGNDMKQIHEAFEYIKSKNKKPKCLIANTIKGKGVSFMENIGKWHRNIPSYEEYIVAKQELTSFIKEEYR